MSSKTIDNLGYDASQRYAFDQQFLDGQDKIHKEAKILFGESHINTATPAFNSEVETLLNASEKTPAWAAFSAPEGYFEHKKRFFSHQLIPHLSTQEESDGYARKIKEYAKKKEERDSNEKSRADWEAAKEAEETDKEKTVLLNLLNCILNLDKCMLYVNSKRAQYHKG